MIDNAFKNLVERRLNKIARKVTALTEDNHHWARDSADEMAQGAFQGLKCGWGTTEGTHSKFRIKVPGFLPKPKTFPEAFIDKQQMTFTEEEMSGFFDSQVEGIFSILDDRLNALEKRFPSKQVDYLVLSGGLGSSRYIQDRITERYVNSRSYDQRHTNAKHLKIYQADNPQTAVVQGLVLNQAQQYDSGSGVLQSRTSPASYGVLRIELWNEDKHFGMKKVYEELDGQEYAVDLIHWFVKKVLPFPYHNLRIS